MSIANQFRVGVALEVQHGLFTGWIGTVVALDGDTVAVMVTVLGKSGIVKMHRWCFMQPNEIFEEATKLARADGAESFNMILAEGCVYLVGTDVAFAIDFAATPAPNSPLTWGVMFLLSGDHWLRHAHNNYPFYDQKEAWTKAEARRFGE
jgi:hypothetical protein